MVWNNQTQEYLIWDWDEANKKSQLRLMNENFEFKE
jgi:hypothetical protein